MPSPRIIYSPRYRIRAMGMDHLHPFDLRKYERAVRLLRRKLGDADLTARLVAPRAEVSREDVLLAHTPEHVDGVVRSSVAAAAAVEVPQLALLPARLVDRALLRPMRWATAGTVLACREALRHGAAVNLGGGFHHACADHGEGFCIYNDIVVAIRVLRREGLLKSRDRGGGGGRVLYIDLDAHQGNGVERLLMDDRDVFILDQYNATTYPNDLAARRRIDCDIRMEPGDGDHAYLGALTERLEPFLNAVRSPALAIYNAGTDVYSGDAIGDLRVSLEGVARRDQMVLSALTRRGIPWVMLPSGGYSAESYRMIGSTVEWACRQG